MLESEVHYEHDGCKDHGCHKDKQSGTLELAPSGPRDLLGQFDVRLLKIAKKLSHLSF